MRIIRATLESVSPYSQSRFYDVPREPRELPGAYEERTWRERCNVMEDGHIFIPPMAFKNCLSSVAKYMSVQIPGKGKATYTKHFEAGILVTEGLILPDKKDAVQGEALHVPSDGRRGGGKRVKKIFPLIPNWKGEVTFCILDDIITREVFEEHLRNAGSYVGIGRFRPQNNGYYGRFKIVELKIK